MSNVSSWSTTAGSNNSTPPNGWPEGMAPSAVNDAARENMAALAKVYKDQQGTIVTAGTSTVYTLATNNAHATLAAQGLMVFRAHVACGASPTLNVDGLGAKTIRSRGAALTSGALLLNDHYAVTYNATDDAYDLHTLPATLNGLIANGLTYPTVDGTNGQVLTTNGAGVFSLQAPATAPQNSQAFTASGTWTKPLNVTFVLVESKGAGGGGCGGGHEDIGSSQYGGSGGGGGAYRSALLLASACGATETVTIGSGGAGGSGGTSASAEGAFGGTGGNTTFGALVTAYGGGGGSGSGGGGGGLLSAASGSSEGWPTTATGFYSAAGAISSVTVTANAGFCSVFGGPGGGGGGGITTGLTALAGGAGGSFAGASGGGSGGGAATGSAGSAGSSGTGGGGGGASTSSIGGNGGAGSLGSGGGGGGTGRLYDGGVGGNGGNGWMRVTSW